MPLDAIRLREVRREREAAGFAGVPFVCRAIPTPTAMSGSKKGERRRTSHGATGETTRVAQPDAAVRGDAEVPDTERPGSGQPAGGRAGTTGFCGAEVEAEMGDVALAASGDANAFERLYRRHVGRIYALAARMAGDAVAEELTQEVFVRAWERLASFRGQARFGTWLYRLAVNHVLTRMRSLKAWRDRHVEGDEVLEYLAAPRQTPPGLAGDLERAIRSLPERARAVFVLHDVEGYPHEEIARMMGTSVGTSKSQLHRARVLLRGLLS